MQPVAPSLGPRVEPPIAAQRIGRPATAPKVCPFLSLRDDRLTRYEFAHTGNVCHALHRPPAESGWRGLIARRTGVGPKKVAPEHQAMLCLSSAHERCPRYTAAMADPQPAPSALWSNRTEDS